jgi:subtilisin family serine protease
MARLPRLGAVAVLAVVSLALTGGTAVGAGSMPTQSPVSAPRILGADSGVAVPGHYVVKLKDDASVTERGIPATARQMAGRYGAKVGDVWQQALHGFSTTMSADQAQKLAADPDVAWVQQQQPYHVEGSQSKPSEITTGVWGIDRLDQRQQPLNGAYHYQDSAGAGVHVYVIDTGIHKDNTDFGGRASYGPNFVTTEAPAHANSDDCEGHGTGVAGLIGGAKYGVAKAAQLVAVRVFDCHGNLPDEAPLLNAINWVLANAVRPAVINMSLGARCVDEDTHEETPCPVGAVQDIITAEQAAINAGIPVITAAGNALPGKSAINACTDPVSAAGGTINVGAVNADDSYWTSSDFGGCVDIWAPGTNLQTDSFESNSAAHTDSGTSFAAPLVSGAVAMLLGTGQFASVPPNQLAAQVAAQIDANATLGQITGLPDELSPNKILYAPPTAEGSSVALAKTSTGALMAFGTNSAGNMFFTTQTAPNALSWNKWLQSGSSGWLSVALDANADQRVQMIALTNSDQVWQRQQTAKGANGFNSLSQLTGLLRSSAIARNQNGQLEVLGVNRQGAAFYSTQTSAGASTFSAFAPFTGAVLPLFTSIAAETDANNLIEVFAVDTHGNVWQTKQTSVNANTWSAFAPMAATTPARLVSEVAVARDGNNKLDLIATDASGAVYQRSQTAAGSATWTGWTQIGTAAIMHLAAETGANGDVTLLTVDSTGSIFQMDQESPGSTSYDGFIEVDGGLRP